MLRVDVWGRNWHGLDYVDEVYCDGWWNWEGSDTDMGGMDSRELEEYFGPTFPSKDHWLLVARECRKTQVRWLRQDRRHRPDLRCSW